MGWANKKQHCFPYNISIWPRNKFALYCICMYKTSVVVPYLKRMGEEGNQDSGKLLFTNHIFSVAMKNSIIDLMFLNTILQLQTVTAIRINKVR